MERYTQRVEFLPEEQRDESGQSGAQDLYWASETLLFLKVSAATGDSPELDVKIQTQDPDGDWHDLTQFTKAVKATNEAKALSLFGQKLRAVYTISANATFTFSLVGIAKS